MYLCASGCGLWFATWQEAWDHGRTDETAAACAELRRQRAAAKGRASYQRMLADPERAERRRARKREYRERIRVREQERKRRQSQHPKTER
jgi:hypothetical protein